MNITDKTTPFLVFFSVLLTLLHYSCSQEKKAPARLTKRNLETTTKKSDLMRTNLDLHSANDEEQKKPLHNLTQNLNKVLIIQEKKQPTHIAEVFEYSIPALSHWANHFENDPKWIALYHESVNHYLIGVKNNLQQQPNLSIAKSMLIFVYGKKMNETFPLSPEYVEFAKYKFEHSTELRTFIQTYPTRIIED